MFSFLAIGRTTSLKWISEERQRLTTSKSIELPWKIVLMECKHQGRYNTFVWWIQYHPHGLLGIYAGIHTARVIDLKIVSVSKIYFGTFGSTPPSRTCTLLRFNKQNLLQDSWSQASSPMKCLSAWVCCVGRDFTHNKLTGTIPSIFGLLPLLTSLYVHPLSMDSNSSFLSLVVSERALCKTPRDWELLNT